jgi:hypothetical protein
MNASGNQIRARMIAEFPKTDREKLAGLETFVHQHYPDKIQKVVLEPFILFTKGEDECYGWRERLTRSEVERFLVHPCDILLITYGNEDIFFELDGGIHDIKTEKTSSRNRRYELNDMKYIVINEADLKLKLGVPKSNKLSQVQINHEFSNLLEVNLK